MDRAQGRAPAGGNPECSEPLVRVSLAPRQEDVFGKLPQFKKSVTDYNLIQGKADWIKRQKKRLEEL